MSLSTAFNVISSSFAASAAQTAVVSNNIANVNTPGYSREIANVVTNSYGGSDVASITREANAALLEQVSASSSQAAAQQAISDGLTTLAQTGDDSSSATSASGAQQNGASPSAMLANLQSALTTYSDSTGSTSAADAVVSAASDLASSLNSASATVQQVRETADQKMASSVNTINSLLNQFAAANNTVVTGLQTGANVSSAEDTRDSIVTQLAQQIGVSFTPTPTLVDGANGAPVTVDGVPITGTNSPMPIQSGALAGYAALRDTVAPEYQGQLDQVAGGLINAFAESDQSAHPTPPYLPGLFTTPGATSLPSTSATPGLAAAIEVNPNVDPSQGGNPNLLRDGGISDPGNPAYTYNTTGAASYTGRIQELIGQISATQSFDPSAGLGSSSSLIDYANASVSWVQAENQQASDSSSYQNALATQATSALSNATGVNLDAEMTNMLNLENSYASSAKLLTTVTSMFSALLQAA